MKKAILKTLVAILVFTASLYISGFWLNKGNVNTTRDMEMAMYPVIYSIISGETVNEMYGYSDDMDISLFRDNITPLDENRGVSLRIAKYGRLVDSITAKIRTVDGSRLIENIEVTDYEEDDYGITFNINLKDLISQYTEYALEIYLDIGYQKPIMYQTRVIDAPSYCAKEKLAFVSEFHKKSMRPETAVELSEYMESNRYGDNSSLAFVNIHSSMDQLSFASLDVKELTNPICHFKELAKETAVFTINYLASTEVEGVHRKYAVEEYYRIKYTTETTYLLDYERRMHQLPDEDRISPYLNTILLGITENNIDISESQDGNIIAFVDENKLYSYNISENKMVKLFGFYDNSNFDERTYHNEHKIKVLRIDEAGNVWFLVYGYMNRGTYEGRVGFTLYEYNGLTNVIDEILFISSDKPSEMVMHDIDELSYLNKNGIFFFVLDRAIYAVDTKTSEVSLIVSELEDNMYSISDSMSMVVWQNGKDINASTSLNVMNLNTYQISMIEAPRAQYIKPLAFMGEDFIYGLAYRKDVVMDNTGRTTFPMYMLKIQNEYGELMKKYGEEGYYVSDVHVVGNLLTMERVRKADSEALSYVQIESDYMTNNQEEKKTSNRVEAVDNGIFEKVIQIRLTKEASGKTIWLTPKEVIYEGSKEIQFERALSDKRYYYVYYNGHLQSVGTNEAYAVSLADTKFGVVLNDAGYYVWYRANRDMRNQIMSLSIDKQTDEAEEELYICLDKIMEYEGIVRNSEYLLKHGGTVLSILEDNMENMDILDLTGCSLDNILYYVNRDIPVLARTHGDDTYLIIGFNQLSVVVMDPTKGTYKIGRNEAEDLFYSNGNQFITYVPISSK
ncbi:MAG: hypothetical protein MJ123_05905 [Lachnospiraceae bacterium]|nr:hypothetical protein [Lachnospiraceae bacterium]